MRPDRSKGLPSKSALLDKSRAITPNERAWIEVIRLASWDSDPAPTLDRVQRLRAVFMGGQSPVG